MACASRQQPLEAELLFNAALVRFAAGLQLAAGRVPTVTENVDGFAFSRVGAMSRRRSSTPPADEPRHLRSRLRENRQRPHDNIVGVREESKRSIRGQCQ